MQLSSEVNHKPYQSNLLLRRIRHSDGFPDQTFIAYIARIKIWMKKKLIQKDVVVIQ